MGLDLFPHNMEAYESALTMLQECGKAAVVHPTGTGKSFIGFKLCEDYPDKTICWLSPSEYIFKTQTENLKKASNGWIPDNVSFFTYAKLMQMDEGDISRINPDFIILDEFHRCGAEMWGAGVSRLISYYPKIPILGLSATAIRYLDNQRDMASELFDGNIASEMTLGEAIVRGILETPKYVTSVFAYNEDFERIKKRVNREKNKAVRDQAEIYLEAIRRALEKADGLDVVFKKHISNKSGKYIVFCSNHEHLCQMRDMASDWFSEIDPNPHVYIAYCDDPETSRAFAQFKGDGSNHLKLLFCIDMLNEGIHVDDISGVILFRPTVSPIIYKQQIGRALSANKNGCPIIFDIVNNIENLSSIGALQQEMQIAVNYYRFLGENGYIVNERFKVVDEVQNVTELFDKLNDTLTTSWETMFGYAKEYFKEHGNLEVPRRYRTADGYSLGNWIFTQRKVYSGEQYGRLDEGRIRKLESIGMVWDSMRDLAWKRFYAEAENYFKEKGDLKVPAHYVTANGLDLGKWISNIRTYRKNGTQTAYLSKERIKQLDSIGMIWETNDYLWEENYSECMRFFRENGHLNLNIDEVSPNGLRIGRWVANQRKRKKDGLLTEEQVSRLDSIGMDWRTRLERLWENGFAEAERYFLNHGNLDVPATYVSESGFKLGDWISNRREYGKTRLSLDKQKKLDSLGMVWDKPNSWEKRFIIAREYYEKHGNLKMSGTYQGQGIWISKWLSEQRQIYLGRRIGKSLTPEQIDQLNSIGMKWDNPHEQLRMDAWKDSYRDAKAFFSENGHLNVPRSYIGLSGKKLDLWVQRQRVLRRKGKLSERQIRLLDEIGMVWKTDDPWEIGFQHAEAFFKAHGNLRVAQKYVCKDGFGLGRWIFNQRSAFNGADEKKLLSEEHKIRLDSIGMDWSSAEDRWMTAYEHAKTYLNSLEGEQWKSMYVSPDGFRTGEWIRNQLRNYRNHSIKPERASMLAEIGLISNDAKRYTLRT